MRLRRSTLLMVSSISLCYSGSLIAQNNEEGKDSSWQVSAGAGVLARPEFPGSDSLEILPLPAFNITYGERWFLNADGLGAYLVKRDRASMTLSLAPDATRRDESDSAHLRGVGDVDRTAVARFKGAYNIGSVTATAALSTDVADQGHGTVVELTLQSRADVTPRFSLSYGIAARWLDDEYAESFFAIDPQQSRRSGLALYEAQNGLGDARLFVNAVYVLSPRWIIAAGTAVGQLQGDAKDSPIVEDDSYFQFDTALMYRF